MFGNLGLMEISIIACIAVLIFGPRQLPKMGRSIGEAIKEFKGAGRELRKAVGGDVDDPL